VLFLKLCLLNFVLTLQCVLNVSRIKMFIEFVGMTMLFEFVKDNV
jgi:hypothetical protein